MHTRQLITSLSIATAVTACSSSPDPEPLPLASSFDLTATLTFPDGTELRPSIWFETVDLVLIDRDDDGEVDAVEGTAISEFHHGLVSENVPTTVRTMAAPGLFSEDGFEGELVAARRGGDPLLHVAGLSFVLPAQTARATALATGQHRGARISDGACASSRSRSSPKNRDARIAGGLARCRA